MNQIVCCALVALAIFVEGYECIKTEEQQVREESRKYFKETFFIPRIFSKNCQYVADYVLITRIFRSKWSPAKPGITTQGMLMI